MKFLYFGDRHNSERMPANRIDDFKETCIKKDLEIIELGKKNNVSAFLHPGDFWNDSDHKISNEFIQEVVKRWTDNTIDSQKILKQIKNNEIKDLNALYAQVKKYIPLIGVVGNHDLIGNDIASLPNTTTGLLYGLGIMEIATKENPYYFYTDDGLKIAITGTNYHLGMDNESHIDDYVIDEKLGDFHIHIVHGMLSDKSLGKLIRHTTLDQIRHTKADITLCGHDHIGFPTTNIDGKYFVNIGSVTRIRNDKKEIGRMPKVMLIDITKANGIKLEEIYLKSAEQGELVLDRIKIEEKKEREFELEEYKRETREFGLTKTVQIKDIISEIAKSEKIPNEIKDDVIDRITKKETEMISSIPTTTEDDVYIKKVIIENFQSHKYTELNFSKGFNVLVGESRQGKSAILRALRWVYENKPAGKSIIKRGEKEARVTVYLANGTIVSRFIQSASNGKNGFKIVFSDGSEREGNTKLLPEVQNALGFNDFIIDKDLTIPLNFMKQGESWFLIGNKYTSVERAKIIGAIKDTHFADAVKRDLEKENSKLTTEINNSKKKLEKIDQSLEKFDYLVSLEEQIELFSKKVNSIDKKRQTIEKIKEITLQIAQTNDKIKESDLIIHETNNLNGIRSSLTRLIDKNTITNKIQSTYEELYILSRKMNSLLKYINFTNNIYDWKNKFNNVKKSMEMSEKLDTLNNSYKEIVENKNLFENIISAIPDTRSLHSKILKVRERLIEKEKQESLLNVLVKLTKDTKLINNNIIKINYVLANTKTLEDLKIKLTNDKEKHDKLAKLLQSFKNYKDIESKITLEKGVIAEKSKIVDQNIEEYKKLLNEEKICPICYGTLDKAVVNEIIKKHKKGAMI